MFDTGFIDPYFSLNYISTRNNNFVRGAYHFAHPNVSSGAAQATYFLAHGGKAHTFVTAVRFLTLCVYTGGWTSDGITLPGAIDLEGAIMISNLLTIRKNPSHNGILIQAIAPACPRHKWLHGLRTFPTPTIPRRRGNSTSFPLLFAITDSLSDIQACCFLATFLSSLVPF